MAKKKDDNTIVLVLLGVGAFILFEKLRGTGTIAPVQAPVIQKTNPVATNATKANTGNTVTNILKQGGNLLSNLFNGGSTTEDTSRSAAIDPTVPDPGDYAVYDDTISTNQPPSPSYMFSDNSQQQEMENTNDVMPFNFVNVSGISLVKKTIRRDEND